MDDKSIKLKHSASHIMTAAVQMLYGKDKISLGVGPWTEEGFYQDFDFGKVDFKETDLKKIEKKMRWIINKDFPIKKQVVSKEEALALHKGDRYKEELIEEISKNGEEISVYYIGENLENAISSQLCEGPHIEKTGQLKAFKLTKIAGAYWRGDENNPMLTRIYGVAFEDEEELKKYQEKIEEAKKRDHRKLGKELGLFTFSDLIGAGLPLFTPKGTLMRDLITNKIWGLQKELGWKRVTIPHITKKELYETSGHWEKFKDDLFKVKGKGDTQFVMKPMNCPHHTQIYASEPRSYKDLPMRFAENGVVYRDEQAGELLGLARVRAITQDDGHAFCAEDQIEEEIRNIVSIIKSFYTSLGMYKDGEFWVSLSVSDPKHPEKYMIEEDGLFIKAEETLERIAKEENLPYKRIEGEAAFYGPKLDFQFKDALGREWQLGTVQLDFSMPKRFNLEYTDKDGKKKRPIMIHRAIAGSLERFMAVMIEHFAGHFPVWLAPEQLRIIPIANEYNEYAQSALKEMQNADIRVYFDNSTDSLGKKIRKAKTEKIPYIAVIGEDEQKTNSLKIEASKNTDIKSGVYGIDEFIQKLQSEISA